MERLEKDCYQNKIVAKALDGQRYPLPLCERGSGPEGADDLCLVSFERRGHNMSLEL